MLKVGSKFYTFDELSSRLEEFQVLEQVQLWVRDSRTVVAAAKRARRKSLNPALKYAELTYSCVFGGRRPSDQTKIHNQTSAGGCPFKVRLSTSIDGQALVVKEICHEHNHEPGKKLHEEPRRLYKKTQNRTAVRKPVRYIVNKQRVSSGTSKTKGRLDHTESHVQLGQSPFHHLQLHQQQYQQQQQQLKLQLQQHLQQQQQQQQQLRQKQAEVIQLDSPDHVDTPEHLSSPDLSTTFDQLGSLNNSVDQYTYLPPSPISPSLSSGCPVDCEEEEEERLEPILDLEEALEEALGDLDSVGSMEVDATLRLASSGNTTSSLMSQSEAAAADDSIGPPPVRRQRGRPRKQSFTGTPMKGEKSDHSKAGETKEERSSDEEEDFLGFSPSTDKGASKTDMMVSRADILQASAMARQLHVYKPGIDFVPGARLEVLESRDNNWYQCKIVEVDWGELDILVHYERWSNRFDEWLKMDSTRIRSLSRGSQRRERSSSSFSVGDRVLARWSADGKRYQARVTKELGDDQYEVLFFDGVAKVLRSAALAKVDSKSGEAEEQRGSPFKQPGTDDEDSLLMSPETTSASSTDSRSSSPEPEQSSSGPGRAEELMEVETVTPVRKNIFDVEIIEQKRKPKRKAAVEELFQSLKKRRKCEQHSKKEESFSSPKHHIQARASTPSPRQQQQQQVRQVQSKKASLSKKKGREAGSGSQEEPSVHQAEAASSEVPESPVSVQSPRIVSVLMHDGWRKCCSQRTHGSTAGKWDTFYLAPEGKKIRCKNDLYRYCEEFGVTCDIEKFDFSVKNMKEIIDAQVESRGIAKPSEEHKEPEKEPSASQVKKEPEVKSPPPLQESSGISKIGTVKKIDVKKPEIRQIEMTKHSESPRMKLEIPLIPKTEHIGTFPPSLLGTSAGPWSPTMPSPLPRSLPATASTSSEELMTKDPVGLGGYASTELATEPTRPSAAPIRQRHVLKKEPVLAPNEFIVRAEHNEHQCPKGGCGKSFRKENLLQMHIKHYHPELLKKSSNWAPNVADLAYARTVGDHLDTGSSPSHSSPPAEKPVKSEMGSKKPARGLGPVSFLDPRGKTGDKKTSGTFKTITISKEYKKKDKGKLEPEQGTPISEDETESKEEIEDYIDDLEEESPISTHGLQMEDPDYVPSEGDILQMKKDRKEKRKTRGESKGKKKKLAEPQVPEPSTSTPPSKKTQGVEAEALSIEAEEDTGDAWVEGTEGVPTSETSAEIINCGCGSTEEEGLMLQCDVCLCWQHGDCYNIVGEDQVPDKYICSLCDHPRLERSSHKFRHHQDWLKEGRLPRFSFSSSRGDLRLEACIRRGHELTANVLQLSQVLHSLRLKLHIAKEADHPKFVMWHKKWDEQEETSIQGQEEKSTNPEAVAPLQDIMNIVEQEDPCLSTQVADTKMTNQTHDFSITNSLARTTVGDSEKLSTGPAIFPETWNVPDKGLNETQGSDLQADSITEDVVSLKDQADFDKETMDVMKQPVTWVSEKETTNLSEVLVTEHKKSDDSPKDEQKDSCSSVESSSSPQNKNEPQISLPSEREQNIPGIVSFVEFREKELENNEESKDTVNISAVEECPEDSLQVSLKEEISAIKEKPKKEDDIVSWASENTDSVKRDGTAQENTNDKEDSLKKSKPSQGDPTKEASLPQSQKSLLPSCKESANDLEHPEEYKSKEINMEEVKEMEENKTEVSVESETELVKEEKLEALLESKPEIKPMQEDNMKKGQVKQAMKEACRDYDTAHKKGESKTEHMLANRSSMKGISEKESNIAKEDSEAPKIPPKVEGESCIAKTERGELDEKDPVKDTETKDKEQGKLPDSSGLGALSMSHSGAEDTLNEEDTHLEDGDELPLDLGGLGATGEGGMPGGSELAALLSSQTELEQLVSQASSALAPVSANVESVQAPIIPEAERIEPVNCKLNLLEHLQGMQTSITQRFDDIEQQLEVLEAEMGLAADVGEEEAEEDSEERDPATLQARALIKLVMNDLSIVKKIADFTH